MRTTVDISDDLFRKLKVISSIQGITLKQFITRALEREIANGSFAMEQRRVNLPIVRSKKPGSAKITPENIAALLEVEDLSVSS